MDEDVRAECNRMWGEMRAMQLFTARFAARHFTRDEISAWHESAIAAFEARADFSDAYKANMARALDDLARVLRDARDAYAPPPG